MLDNATKMLQSILSFFMEISASAEGLQPQQRSSRRRIPCWRRRILQRLAAGNKRTPNISLGRLRIEEAPACRVIKTRNHRIADFYRNVVVANIARRLPCVDARMRQESIVIQYARNTLTRGFIVGIGNDVRQP